LHCEILVMLLARFQTAQRRKESLPPLGYRAHRRILAIFLALSRLTHQRRLKQRADASVHASESASNLPMLDVPGKFENHRLPNAVAVIGALKKPRNRPPSHETHTRRRALWGKLRLIIVGGVHDADNGGRG